MCGVRLLSLRMPLRFLRGNYGRLSLTVIALACGVAQVAANDLVSRAALQAFVDVIDTVAGRASLQISSGDGGLFADDVATSVAAVPGVEFVVPVVSATAFATGASGELLAVQGMDVTDDKAVGVYELSEEAGWTFDDPKLLLPDAIVVTRAFADARGHALGDTVDLDTPRGTHRFAIRGMLEPHGVARLYQGNLIVMDLHGAQRAFGSLGFINRVDVVAERSADAGRVAEAISAVLPPGLRVEAPTQRKADLNKAMRAFGVLLSALDIVGLGAAFLIAFNGLSTVFEGRAWQLGILRAIGVRMRVVWRELVKESLLLGVAGVVLGIPSGLGLARVLLPEVTKSAALNAKLATPNATLAVHGSSLVLAAGLGFLAAVLAAALPAWRAARGEVVETLRDRGVERAGQSASAHWLMRAAVGAGIAGAIVLQLKLDSVAWGVVATGLLIVGTALAGRPLVDMVSGPLLRGWTWMAGPAGRFAAMHLSRNPRRTSLTVSMLGVGLGCVLWLWTVAQSFEQSVIDVTTQAMRSDLVVSSVHIESGFLETPVDELLMTELHDIAGVVSVTGNRVVDWHYAGGPIAIDAFDPVYFTDVTFGQWPLFGARIPGVWEAVARGEAAVVTNNFVAKLGAKVGEALTLDTPAGPLALLVGGVSADFTSPRGSIIMSRDLYKRYWNDARVTRTFVRTAPGTDIATVRATIAGAMGRRYGLRILSSAELIDYFASQVRLAFAGVYILAGLVLFVAVVGISDTLAAGVIERTREIGAIRVVGVQRRYVHRMVLIEGMVLGVLGLVLAGAAGIALGTLWVAATFPYLFGWVLSLHLPYGHAIRLAVVTLVAALAAGHLPARRAAGLEPAVALRYE
jgi:putative ABC transport system permease protein